MLSLVVFFMVLSVGSVVCASVWGRRFEELLPVTASSIVLILFLCGICGILKTGVYLVCFLAASMYCFAIFWIIRKKCLKNVLENIFTPAFFIFLLLCLCLAYFGHGKMASDWDEFSHWADIVKAMVSLDDFGTNPVSGSPYASYPPGMALLQYFMQKLHAMLTGWEFCEWRLYYVYQVFFLSLLMPFLKNLKRNQPFTAVVSIIVIVLCPICFFSKAYTVIYIDLFLGILSGAGLAGVFLNEKKDIIYSANIMLTCSMLVLAKDAGLLFAILLGCAYLLDYLFLNPLDVAAKNRLHKCMCVIAAVAAVVIPKILWSYNIKVNGAAVQFGGAVDFKKLWMVFIGKDDTYLTTVFKNFGNAMVTRTITIGNTSLTLSYLAMTLLLIVIIAILCRLLVNKASYDSRKGKLLVGIVCIQAVVYTLGLCITYMFKFTEYEATRLASFERYMNIMCMSLWIVAVFLMLAAWERLRSDSIVMTGVILICAMVIIAPMEQVVGYLQRTPVTESIQMRSRYDVLSKKIENLTEEQPRVFIVCQESTGLERLVMRYILRPRGSQVYGGSIGQAFYDGDIWTRTITAEQWQQELMDGYDYVAILTLNDYFTANFSSVFQNPDEIAENEMYRINKQTRMLERYE